MSDKHEVLHTLLRTSVSPFIKKSFETLNPGVEFLDNWHIDALAYGLEKCERDETKRLLITMPPLKP